MHILLYTLKNWVESTHTFMTNSNKSENSDTSNKLIALEKKRYTHSNVMQ